MSALSGPAPNGLRAHALKGSASARLGRNLRLEVGAFSVRPYTLRKGDTWESIAEKRGFEVQELQKLNHSIKKNGLVEGTTIVLPAGALSDRDKEIIQGIGWRYRTYPVRAGESIEAITSKRGITMAEIEKLNPDVDTKKLKTNQVLKLPANKYTVREREMLMGVAGVPTEFFQSKGFTVSACVLVVVGVVGVITWWKERTDSD
ncbi:unnamed protein product [Ostreobium quekettii]|uniref:LysM domain-containing protein n=1 Tax=Ostreobium quekettii TaxID=121088 RepID=A0A8S1IVE3_9CHLO|nr:unnamed protein product [Ostreobium quekettii]|eukprot:evm.model.scf_180.6 EVM.evm.TU.scf_180.6   scf_180:68823-72476(-)